MVDEDNITNGKVTVKTVDDLGCSVQTMTCACSSVNIPATIGISISLHVHCSSFVLDCVAKNSSNSLLPLIGAFLSARSHSSYHLCARW